MSENATTLVSSNEIAVPNFSFVIGLLILVLVMYTTAAVWRVYTKAGKPGWASLVPIYNSIVMLEIAGRPLWWFVLLLIPFVGIVYACIATIDVARAFEKSRLFGVLLICAPFIGYPMLAWGSAKYSGVPAHPAKLA